MLPSWTPDLATLDLLLSVAELGSVGRAAEAHGIAQPSASAKLTQLERRLGLSVLVRTSRGTTLTPVGETVVAWAREVVAAAHVLADGVLTLRHDRAVRLRIAASLTIAEYLLPEWLLELRRKDPASDVSVLVTNSHEVVSNVRAGNADLGLVESPSLPDDLSAQRIGSDRLVLVVSPDYPLAARAHSPLRPHDMADLVLLVREPGSGTRDTFFTALATALHRTDPPPLPHASELGSTTTIIATARAGGGVGVVSARAAAADIAAGTLVELSVSGLALTRDLHALWAGQAPPALGAALIRVAAARA
jgi:DNA-binding transcriptional LysR family regulator